MRLNRLETHDRLLHFIKDQSQGIEQGVTDCLRKNPLSLALQERSPYIYIFAHPRTHDDCITKRMYWQPRLSKPEPQSNSYLFRIESKTETIEICWMLPPWELWQQFGKGNVTENEIVVWSINEFLNEYKRMSSPDERDLSEEQCKNIMRSVIKEHVESGKNKRRMIETVLC